MKIKLLDIKGFGKFNRFSVNPGEGFNIIFEDNESGKSTLQDFIGGMLYGLKGGRKSKDGSLPPLKHYKPWEAEQYSGVLEYALDDGFSYRVGRNFDKSTVKIYDQNANDVTNDFPQSKDVGPKFAEEHLGLDEESFKDSVFIRQMQCAIDDNGRKALVEKLSNLTTTGSEELSLTRAVTGLESALLERVGTLRSSTRPLNLVNDRLNELKQKARELTELNEKYLDTALELQEKKVLLEEFENTLGQKEKQKECVKILKLKQVKDEYDKLFVKAEETKRRIVENDRFIDKNKNYENIEDDSVSKAKMLLYEENRAKEDLLAKEETIKSLKTAIEQAESNIDPEETFTDKISLIEEQLKVQNSENISAGVHNKKGDTKNQKKRVGIGGIILSIILMAVYVFSTSPVVLAFSIVAAIASLYLLFTNSAKTKLKQNTQAMALSQALIDNGFADLSEYFAYKEEQIKGRSVVDNNRQKLRETEHIVGELKNRIDEINSELSAFLSSMGNYQPADKAKAVELVKKGIEDLRKTKNVQTILKTEKINIEDNCKTILRQAASIAGKPVNNIEELGAIIRKLHGVYGEVAVECDGYGIDEEIESLKNRINDINLHIAGLRTRLEQAPAEGELVSVMEEIELCMEKKKFLEKIGAGLQLAIQILNETALNMQRNFIPSLNKEMSMIINDITCNRYNNVAANDKLLINLQVPETEELIPVSRLSGGTIDQVYFSMRIAAIRLLEKDRETLPLFLDEPFSQYDENRVKRAFEFLKEISKERQVFFFTCREREFELAQEVFGTEINRIKL